MLCDQCHINEAGIKMRLSRNDETVDLNLCPACAKKMQLGSGLVPSLFDSFFSPNWPNYDLLSSALFGSDLTKEDTVLQTVKKCPSCGQSYEEFRKTGLLGCANCYEVFKPALEQMLKRVQRGTRHIGHRPKSAAADSSSADEEMALENKISELQKQLQEAVQIEDYLQAVELRDKIRELEQN